MTKIGKGTRLQLPGEKTWVTVRMIDEDTDGTITLGVADDTGRSTIVTLSPAEFSAVTVLTRDRSAPSARVLAGMWTQWMSAANHNAPTTMLAAQ